MFYPVHTMPMYSKKFMRHPVAEGLAWRGINLPSFPDLTEEDVAYISGIIMKFS
jgi:perosamine synthetase